MTAIVQLTDTHVTERGRLAYGRVDTGAALARAVAHIERLAKRIGGIDAVVVSGDLVDLGTPGEYAIFREIAARLAPQLYVLPGNHDERGAFRAAFADAAYLPPGDGPLDWTARVGRLRLIGLDTTVPGRPHGALSPVQHAWLTEVLETHWAEPTLIFAHHPPFETGIGHMDRQGLHAGSTLLARIARYPQVALLSCGHVHRAISARIGGVACMIAPAPAHAVALDHREGAPAFEMEPGAVTLHEWMPEVACTPGYLRSQISPIGPFEGPYPFFAEDGGLIR